MAKLEIEDVVVCFGDVVAVDRVSLQVEEGETVVLLGPSGCGKTTLLRLVAGFNRPKSGTVRIAGRIVDGRGAARETVALHGVPELCGLAAQDRIRKPRLWVAAAPHECGNDLRESHRCARDGAHGGLREPLPERTLRRTAAARGAGTRSRPRAGNIAVRRTLEQSRCDAARAHAVRDQGAAFETQDHQHLRNARS